MTERQSYACVIHVIHTGKNNLGFFLYHHRLRVYASRESLPKESQLAWQLARIATDRVPVDPEVADMIINRFIDNASVAIAAVNRRPVANARSQALAHTRAGGATVFGLPNHRFFEAEWTRRYHDPDPDK